jgi:hypothetical protein
MKVLAWFIDMNGIENKNTVKYPCPIGVQKREILTIVIQMLSKKDAATILNTKYMYHGNALCLINFLQYSCALSAEFAAQVGGCSWHGD